MSIKECTDKAGIAKENQHETPEAIRNRDESKAPPFASAENDGDDVQAFDQPVALLHFQTFVDFIDEYLGAQVQLFERMRQGKEQHVSFENLWMLFDSNDTICCPFREATNEVYNTQYQDKHSPIRRHTPQAYRVVATSQGLPLEGTLASTFHLKGLVSTTIPASTNDFISRTGQVMEDQGFSDPFIQPPTISRKVRNSYAQLYVYCFYIDFHGLECGTVAEIFAFKPFEGEVEIRGLQAYPTCYLAEDKFHDRGERFLRSTRISHLQHEGLTVGGTREEVNIVPRHLCNIHLT